MHLSHLALTASVGAALLLFGALAAVGGQRTVALARGLGWAVVVLALFVGAVTESLSAPLAESEPYTWLFLPSRVLRVQALAEDPDLRTRYNLDPRLRYLPPAGERVIDLETAYAANSGLRWVKVPPVVHATPPKRPSGMVAERADEVEREVEGLYESARSLVERQGRPPDEELAILTRTASVGLLAMGVLGLVAGLLPLLGRGLMLGADAARLARATRHPSYGTARRQAVRTGTRGLREWHGERARPHAALATFGLLTLLSGVVLGLLREEETRRGAHETFVQARHLKIDKR